MCVRVCKMRWLQYLPHRCIPPVCESRIFVPSATCSHGQGRFRRRPVHLAHDSVHRKDALRGHSCKSATTAPRKGIGTPGNRVFFIAFPAPWIVFLCSRFCLGPRTPEQPKFTDGSAAAGNPTAPPAISRPASGTEPLGPRQAGCLFSGLIVCTSLTVTLFYCCFYEQVQKLPVSRI